MDYKFGCEYRDVALRPLHLQAAQKSEEDVLHVIANLEQRARSILVKYKPRPLSSDPNDDMVLDLAINGFADAIVTQNARHFFAAAARFSLAVLSPMELLHQLRDKE
jgi:predicted nucleic acid-binding protein